jgi:ubiquinone/menaquinone biosynthesis C-methylase UbiE
LNSVEFHRLDLEPGDRILDVGCGSGRHLAWVYEHLQVSAIGVDRCLEDLRLARSKLQWQKEMGAHEGGAWEIAAADITRLPFRDGFFDLVICAEVLEHIRKQSAAMNEIIRVLKPGKNLVVSVPRHFPERICWALDPAYHQTPGGHVRIYRQQNLVCLLEARGVRKWLHRFAHSLHSPFWWLKCWVGPQREDSRTVNLFHRFLVWDIMHKPRLTRIIERLLNPLLGKSLVIYFKKARGVE